MLANPERLAREDIQFISDLEWRRRFNSDATLVERLDNHVTALVADKSRLEAVTPDNNLVEQARTSLRQVSAPVLMYSSLKPGYLRDAAHAIYLDKEIGLGGDSVFVRKSGVSLSDPILVSLSTVTVIGAPVGFCSTSMERATALAEAK